MAWCLLRSVKSLRAISMASRSRRPLKTPLRAAKRGRSPRATALIASSRRHGEPRPAPRVPDPRPARGGRGRRVAAARGAETARTSRRPRDQRRPRRLARPAHGGPVGRRPAEERDDLAARLRLPFAQGARARSREGRGRLRPHEPGPRLRALTRGRGARPDGVRGPRETGAAGARRGWREGRLCHPSRSARALAWTGARGLPLRAVRAIRNRPARGAPTRVHGGPGRRRPRVGPARRDRRRAGGVDAGASAPRAPARAADAGALPGRPAGGGTRRLLRHPRTARRGAGDRPRAGAAGAQPRDPQSGDDAGRAGDTTVRACGRTRSGRGSHGRRRAGCRR